MEEEFLEEAKKGNQTALNSLLNKYKHFAYTISLRYVSAEDAQDIVQESFIRVFLSIGKFRNEAKFSTWLFKIIYHECIKFIHEKKPDTLTINEEVNAIPSDDSVLDSILLRERNDVIRQAIEQLSPNEYTVISLFYLLEKNITEICEITAMSKANVKVLLHRGRSRLSAVLTKNSRGEK
jgi:RNA polymerase sigma factor (sigma-70 family)